MADAKLDVNRKTILELLQDNKARFLIPDYQRPYSWGEKECLTLWEDLFAFAFPNANCDLFNHDTAEYFLGSIVMCNNNETRNMEIIDGQQRLTTILLLLRAFYKKFENMQDENSKKIHQEIAQCIWETDEWGKPNKENLKINSEVIEEEERKEFLGILKDGSAEGKVSKYAKNFRFFEDKIQDFLNHYASYFALFPKRILDNCILLPVTSDNRETALTIFSTLNNRGLPLSDANIFKIQLYNFYRSIDKKEWFISQWKELEMLCNKLFHPNYGSPMDEAFTLYMYFERAKKGIKDSTTESLRKFYETENYHLLKNEFTFQNIINLVKFWYSIEGQDDNLFSDDVLKQLLILNFAPNGMWKYVVSVYYMANKNELGFLDQDKFLKFLKKLIAFIWAYTVVNNAGVHDLRIPLYNEMINLVNNRPVDFKGILFNKQATEHSFATFTFSNGRPITKSILAWWAFQNPGQIIFPLELEFQIEHIFAKEREEKQSILKNEDNLESLGNKALLERSINIRASDYTFNDKKPYYLGYTKKNGKHKEGTKISELQKLATVAQDFTEQDIENRKNSIIASFINYLEDNNLLEQ